MKKILIALILILVLGWVLFSGGENDDEYFNNYFSEMVKAGEEKNTDEFMDNFSLHYKDDYGLNYIVVKNLVKNVFENSGEINGSFSGLSSSLSKDSDGKETAVVNMDVTATAENNGITKGILGFDNTPDNITVYLEKSTFGSWQIVSVEGIEKAEY